MSRAIIEVRDISKKYVISHRQKEDTLFGQLRSAFSGNKSETTEEFWALRDITFNVMQGEVFGIIGKNGAGKSTLLKILSRITAPTSGEIKIHGRIASLLEVGTGFHPEMTGRENIFLNGAILGMRRKEIEKKFDEIVDFAGVEKFLDTPVKRYSSGMYVRLAFGIAAHLESEVLIIDEVLAVGDAEFQRKCLGKVKDLSANEGRTVIFVSHSMSMITSLCTKALLLNAGQTVVSGAPSDVVLKYYTDGKASPARVDFTKEKMRIGNDYAELIEGYVKNSKGDLATEIDIHEEMIVGMRYKILSDKKFHNAKPYPQFNFSASNGEIVFISMGVSRYLEDFTAGEYIAECKIQGGFLNNETYFVGLGLGSCDKDGVTVHFFENNALSFNIKEVIEETLYETRNGFSGVIPGGVRPTLEWKIQKSTPANLKILV